MPFLGPEPGAGREPPALRRIPTSAWSLVLIGIALTLALTLAQNGALARVLLQLLDRSV